MRRLPWLVLSVFVSGCGPLTPNTPTTTTPGAAEPVYTVAALSTAFDAAGCINGQTLTGNRFSLDIYVTDGGAAGISSFDTRTGHRPQAGCDQTPLERDRYPLVYSSGPTSYLPGLLLPPIAPTRYTWHGVPEKCGGAWVVLSLGGVGHYDVVRAIGIDYKTDC